MIQASDGGRVYVGRSALEIKLRETPIARAYGTSDSAPLAMAATPTERMSPPAVIAPPVENEQIERRLLVARTTLVGLCLTAFACGIVTTVALDHQRLRALEQEVVRAQTEAIAVATQPPTPVAAPVVAEAAPRPTAVAAVAAPPADQPVVVQLPAEVTTAVKSPVASPARPAAGPALVTAARAPRPPAPRVAVRRRAAPTSSPDTAEPAESGTAPAWVDPFAQ